MRVACARVACVCVWRIYTCASNWPDNTAPPSIGLRFATQFRVFSPNSVSLETDETMSSEVSRPRGVFIALAGVLAVSPDAMLLRWMRSLGASSPDVAVAKYIGIIVIMLVLGLCRGTGNALVSPAHFLFSAACQLCYQLSFTFCLLLTDAATALLLISLSPLWAALLGVVTMGEPLPRRTVIALGLSVCSVGLVFMPHLLLEVEAPDRGPSGSRGLNTHGSLAGDLLALFTGLAQATPSAARTRPLAPVDRPTSPLLNVARRLVPGRVAHPPQPQP